MRALRAALSVTFALAATNGVLASIQITSVNRGIRVDDALFANSESGLFDIEHASITEIGRAFAGQTSTIEDGSFTVFGESGEWSAIGDDSFNSRASSFFNVSFSLTETYAFTLSGYLVSVTEAEHSWADFSLFGQGIDLHFTVGSGGYTPFEESGTLQAGDYFIRLSSDESSYNPIGDPGSWAEAYFYANLTLDRAREEIGSVPEIGSLAVWVILLIGEIASVRYASKRISLLA